MKMVMSRIAMPFLLAVLAALPLSSAMTTRARVTPVQKVLTMLGDMKSKASMAMDVEQKTYAKYKEWVSDQTTDLGFEIKTATSDIESLTADIVKADATASQLGKEIGALNAEIDRLSGEKTSATDIRTSEHDEYTTVSQDYSESVDALQRAIQVLKSQDYDRPQAEMLLQRLAKKAPVLQRALAALPQESSAASGAPEVAAYEFQSGGIVGVLKDLLDKFKAQLSDTETQESNQAHFYELEMIHLSNAIETSTKDRDEKASLKAQHEADSAEFNGKLTDTKADKAEDEKLKSDIAATFAAKTSTFKQNQQVRKDEIDAISQATEIIANPEVAASYAKHVNAPTPTAASFLQMRSSKRRVGANQLAAAFLRKKAAALSSKALASLASKLAENPFGKVVTMIEGLLAELREQARMEEEEHKPWCDEQLKNNKLKREAKTSEVSKLSAEIDSVNATIIDMGAQITTLLEEQAALTKAMAEATAQREAEHTENTATIADAEAGSKAVAQAIEILKAFYASTGGESLAQVGAAARQVPEMAAYKGMHAEKGGVVGMLEVIQTDFVRLQAETTAAERQAAAAHSEFMEDSEASKLQKHNMEVKLSLEKDQKEFEQSNLEKDRASAQDQLDKANTYYEYLKPQCVEIHVSYEERKARREEEVEALRQAYQILDSKTKEA